jgi:hypothetical protein
MRGNSSRRQTSLHPSQPSMGPPPSPSARSVNSSISLDPPTDSFPDKREMLMTQRPSFPNVFVATPEQSADHASASLSLHRTDFTAMMANSVSTAAYGKSAAMPKESLLECSAQNTHGSSTSHVFHSSENNNQEKGCAVAEGDDAAAAVVVADGLAEESDGGRSAHRLVQPSQLLQRRLRLLPYPSPTAEKSGALIRATTTTTTTTTDEGLRRATHFNEAKGTPNTTVGESLTSQQGGEGRATPFAESVGPAAAAGGPASSSPLPRLVHPFASPTSTTGPSSYISVRTAAPSTATTTRADDRNTTATATPHDGASLAFHSPLSWTLEQHYGVNASAVAATAWCEGEGGTMGPPVNAGHIETSSMFRPPSSSRGRESVYSVDKSLTSNTQRSVAATCMPSLAKNNSAARTGALSANAAPYRARSRRFSTSVGRNVDSRVYLNTNVMSYYEMAPNSAAASPTPAILSAVAPTNGGVVAESDTAAAASCNEASIKTKSTPIASSMAASASDAVTHTHAGDFSSNTTGAAAATVPSSSPPQRSRSQFSAVGTGSGQKVMAPVSGRFNASDARVQWSRPSAANNSHVVRVVNGLLRSPLLDDLTSTQLSENSLQSPSSNVDIGPGAAVQPDGSGGDGGGGGDGSGAGAYRTNNPISALLTGGRPRTSASGPQQPQPYRTHSTTFPKGPPNTHGYSVSYDSGVAAGELSSGGRNARRPSPQGYGRGGGGSGGGPASREFIPAYKGAAPRRGRSGSSNNNINGEGNISFHEPVSPGSAEATLSFPFASGAAAAAAGTTSIPAPPSATRGRHLSSTNRVSSPWSPPQQQLPPQRTPARQSSPATSGGRAGGLASAGTTEGVAGHRISTNVAFCSSSTLRSDGGGRGGERQAAPTTSAATTTAAQRPPAQRGLSSLKDVFTAASFRSISSLTTGALPTSASPTSLHLHQGVQNAAAAALTGRLSGMGCDYASCSPPQPPPLPPTFALFGALERLSRFSELVQLHKEHSAVIDDFLSRLTMELHRTTHMGTCSTSSLGGGTGATGMNINNNSSSRCPGATAEPRDDREFLRWHRILMYLFHNPSELMKVGVEFFSDAINSWPLHMLYLVCCFHVTACKHGFEALAAALQTGGIICSGKGLFAALAVAMADGEDGLIRSTACMYRAAFYTGVLMSKRHQLFESETRLTTSGGFTLLVVNIPIMTLRRLVTRVNEGYDVFVPMKNSCTTRAGGGFHNNLDTSSSTTAGRRSNVGLSSTSPSSTPVLPSTQSTTFPLHSVIEVSRVISSRSAVLCGHPLDLLRLDMILARFADFNGVKIHKEYLPAGGPENSNFFNKRMPHELLGLWRARGVSFSLASVQLPVYSPVNGDLWANSTAAGWVLGADRAVTDVNGVSSSSLAVPSHGGCRDELFMFLVAEAATAANQDLTYSLRHMRDGSVLLDFSTHAIGIGRLIAWTNKSITVLAAPENRHESSAMPPPRRSSRDTAVLNTLEKLATINNVLRAVSENLEQPPDALAQPRVNLFTTFTELGLLEVMRGADELVGGGGAGDDGGAGPVREGAVGNGKAVRSTPGSSRMLLAPARSFSEHLSGSNNSIAGGPRSGGCGVSGSNLGPAVASVSRAELPGSLCFSPPAPAAGRRMKSNVAALVPAKSFAANPSSVVNGSNASFHTFTNNMTVNGNGGSVAASVLSAPLVAVPPTSAGLSIPSFDAASGAATLSVSFNPLPVQQPPPQPPSPMQIPAPPGPPPVTTPSEAPGQQAGSTANCSFTSGRELPMSASLTGASPGGADGNIEESATPRDGLSGSAGQGGLLVSNSFDARCAPMLSVFTVTGGGLNAATVSAGFLAPSPVSALVHREYRRNTISGSSSSAFVTTPNRHGTDATTTETGAVSINNTAVGLPSGHVTVVTDKATTTTNVNLRESDGDFRAASLPLRAPPSAHQQASEVSSLPSPHVARFTTETDASAPPPSLPPAPQTPTPPQANNPNAATSVQQNVQQQQQLDGMIGTPMSPSALWHADSAASQADLSAGATAAAPLLTSIAADAAEADPSSAGVSLTSKSKMLHDHPQPQQGQRPSPAASAVASELHLLSLPGARCSSNSTTAGMRSLRRIQHVLDTEEPETSASGTSGGGGVGGGLTSPLQQRSMFGKNELSPLSVCERDFVVRRNNDYAGIVNVYQVSPLITYYEMQFNCVLCDGAVLFAGLLRKASGIAFPPYTLLLCPSVFSLLELWDGFEFEERWRRSVEAAPASRATSPVTFGLL